ncbi:voltage-gated sodium channel [Flavobacterium sp. PL11]|jgi:voltage-gated sodium channel|uniref:ion transporter n=1 Tax=Flavobacterium sp. PL11 TaxID=3071717 RepID=UPI002E0A8A9A|nr:voltage-gated sodium channel [Flavobacterium sp. PL11]
MNTKIAELVKNSINQKAFEYFIAAVIIVNCTLIGIETYSQNPLILVIQNIALVIFTIEITLRWIARDSIKSFFSDGWNIFDLTIVLITYVPEEMFTNASVITAIRVLRIFRVFRLLRAFPELKIMTSVLIRSLSALFYNGIFFFIFMYLFAIIGITLFKLPTIDTIDDSKGKVLTEYLTQVPNAPGIAPDPYGSLGETMFTLFRILTGEDWTDLRYNLVHASRMNVIESHETIITIYHVSWFVVATFLLLNLLVGAILNNYQMVMEEMKSKKE